MTRQTRFRRNGKRFEHSNYRSNDFTVNPSYAHAGRYTDEEVDDYTGDGNDDYIDDEDNDVDKCYDSFDEIPVRGRSRQEPKRQLKKKSSHTFASDSGSELDSDVDKDASGHSNANNSSEGAYLRRRIMEYKMEGPAKPNHADWTISLFRHEAEKWQGFCDRIPVNADSELRRCVPETFKTYLEWRLKNSRIRKESCVRSYWKRLSMRYRDLVGVRMDENVLDEICNWIPHLTKKFGLDDADKDKKEMYVDDLREVLCALWAEDPKPLHGRIRLQVAAILLISGATATRPGALVESDACRGSNRALQYKHLTFVVVPNPMKVGRMSVALRVDLAHIKRSGGKTRQKKFIFHEEDNLVFCLVSLVMSLALADNAFESNFKRPEQIFGLKKTTRDAFFLRWKDEAKELPIFRDVRETGGGIRPTDDAMPISKYRDVFSWIGLVCGFEFTLEPYQIRRASGMNINSALTPSERNKTMGHRHGNTFDRYYAADLIVKDFQSIYFGTASQDDLIKMVARMGLSRDKRAPRELTEQHKLEIKNDQTLLKLVSKRDRWRNRIRQKHGTVKAAKGTKWANQYSRIQSEIRNTWSKLARARLKLAIQEFHYNIDTIEVNRQLAGLEPEEAPVAPAFEYEIVERGKVVDLLFTKQEDDHEDPGRGIQIELICNLVQLCKRQERNRLVSCPTGHSEGVIDNRDNKMLAEVIRKTAGPRQTTAVAAVPGNAKDWKKERTPQVCLICLGDEGCVETRRTKDYQRKDILQKHLNTHLRRLSADGPFKECPHPLCAVWLHSIMHFKNHAATVHKVIY